MIHMFRDQPDNEIGPFVTFSNALLDIIGHAHFVQKVFSGIQLL